MTSCLQLLLSLVTHQVIVMKLLFSRTVHEGNRGSYKEQHSADSILQILRYDKARHGEVVP